MDGYHYICWCVIKHLVLAELMKEQARRTGFSRLASQLAIVIIMKELNSPLSQPAKSLRLTPSTSVLKLTSQELCVGLTTPW